MQRPMIIAHRGGKSEFPENSLAAVRHAWALGAEAVEVDVQVTRDGRAAVFHDETTDRMTGTPGVVNELTLHELAARRLLHPVTGRPGDWPIQALEDYLPLIPSSGTFVIELKSAEALPQAVCSVLEKEAADESQMILISFHLEALQFCKAKFPNLRSLWLFRDWHQADVSTRRDRLNMIQGEGLNGVDVKFDPGLTPAHLEEVKAGGLMAVTYTVNQAEEMKRAAELGFDGITTDVPELALDLFPSS